MSLKINYGARHIRSGNGRLIQNNEAKTAHAKLSSDVNPVYVIDNGEGFSIRTKVCKHRLATQKVVLAGYFDKSVDFDHFYDEIDAAAIAAYKIDKNTNDNLIIGMA